jgi:hypothetical protein
MMVFLNEKSIKVRPFITETKLIRSPVNLS